MRSYLRLTVVISVAVLGCSKGETSPSAAPTPVVPAAHDPSPPVAVAPTVTTTVLPPTERAGLGAAYTNNGKLINGQPAANNTPPTAAGPAFGSIDGKPTAQPTATAPAATTAAPKPTAAPTGTAATPGRGVPPPPGGRPKPGSKK
jgi:hypothetical protein